MDVTADQAAGDAAATLDAVATAYWDAYLEANPEFATAIGDARFDDILGDPTPEGAAATRARYTDVLARASRIDPNALDGDGRITLAALRESAGSDIAQIDTRLDDWNLDPLEGVPASFLLIPDYQRLETAEDGRRMLARWRAMATCTDRHLDSVRRSLADGRVACVAPGVRTVRILEELLHGDTADWPLLAPLDDLEDFDDASGWPVADRERFATELADVVESEIRPAFVRLHDALVSEILPHARSSSQPGIGHVAGGLDAYRQLIRVHTSLDLDAETLHGVGLDEIARIDAEIAALAGRTIGAASLADALANLRSDPSLYFSTRDEVFDKAAAGLARANEAIPAWFGRLPIAPCEVVRMGAHEEDHSTIAYYRQPAIDGSRPGQYFINTSHPATRPRYEAEALAYHEAVPGHHLQIAIAQELEGLPAFRRLEGPTAFIEGWGLYSERLSEEMGLLSGDMDRFGILSFDAWRACRLVVDTGLHAMGWSRDRAIAFMVDHTALAENNIANEVDRYLAIPGQALAYKLGQLELLRLRDVARQALGARFDIRAYHDVVLGQGAVGLRTLAGVVDDWTTRSV
jgi:uncharacterized protein (DUF885 family)